MSDDERLEEGFAKLRADDAARAPGFERMWRRPAPKPRSPWAVVVPLGSAAAAAAAILVYCGTQRLAERSEPAAVAVAPPPPPASAVAVDAVQASAAPSFDDPAPLDFLLDVPGHASLARVPDLRTTLLEGRTR